MGKIFKTICLTLASILLIAGLGFGGYSLIKNKVQNSGTKLAAYADDVAKIYNVDVEAFDYDFQDLENNGFCDGILVSGELSDISNSYDFANLCNRIFKNRFVYQKDENTAPEIYEDGFFTYDSTATVARYVLSPNAAVCFYARYFLLTSGPYANNLIIHLTKTSGYSTGSIESPSKQTLKFQYEFNEGFYGENVTHYIYNSSTWTNLYYVTGVDFSGGVDKTTIASFIRNDLFNSITDLDTQDTLNADNFQNFSSGALSSSTIYTITNYSGWYATTIYTNGQYIEIALYPLLDSCYMYLDFRGTSIVSSFSYLQIFLNLSSYNGAINFDDRISVELQDGLVYEKTVLPIGLHSDFATGLHINTVNTDYSFNNLNHAREMLGITEEDGEFSMIERTDYEDYIEYKFNLERENLDLDFTVKVYRNNVCVLDYNKYYYVDVNGNIQTFSASDITRSDSPFVYYYETQTDYYYLCRVDVLTSYQLKISKEILTLELNSNDTSSNEEVA